MADEVAIVSENTQDQRRRSRPLHPLVRLWHTEAILKLRKELKAMAKKALPKTPPSTATAGMVGCTWNLGTDFQTVQIIPATGYWATYKDGGRYPVVAWAIQARLVREDERHDWGDDEVQPGFISRVVGLVMQDKDAPLTEADDYGIGGEDFAGYEWDL